MLPIIHQKVASSVLSSISLRTVFVSYPPIKSIVYGHPRITAAKPYPPKDQDKAAGLRWVPSMSRSTSKIPRVTKMNARQIQSSKLQDIFIPVIKHVPELYIRYQVYDAFISKALNDERIVHAVMAMKPLFPNRYQLLVQSILYGLSGFIASACVAPIDITARRIILGSNTPLRPAEIMNTLNYFFFDKLVGTIVTEYMRKWGICATSVFLEQYAGKVFTALLIGRATL